MNGTHKGIELNFKVEGQTCTSPVGWPIDTAFDSQKFLLKEYPFREDNHYTGTSYLAGLSNRQARFLSGSFSLSYSRDKLWDPFRSSESVGLAMSLLDPSSIPQGLTHPEASYIVEVFLFGSDGSRSHNTES